MVLDLSGAASQAQRQPSKAEQEAEIQAYQMQMNLSLRDMALGHAEKAYEMGLVKQNDQEALFDFAKRTMKFLTMGE